MSHQRRIAVVTGGRPDYGLLRWLMHDLQQSDACELQLVVTGMHFASEFGSTIDEIKRDGLRIAAEVDTLVDGDTRLSMAQSAGRGLSACAEAFVRLRPDMVVVLGDRFEILAAASAAMLLGVPVAHIHGGEITEGSTDEFIRHAVTKMSSLHFVSTEAFRDRVIRMGESPQARAQRRRHRARSVPAAVASRPGIAGARDRPAARSSLLPCDVSSGHAQRPRSCRRRAPHARGDRPVPCVPGPADPRQC